MVPKDDDEGVICWSAGDGAGNVVRKAVRKALASAMVTAESAWSSMMKRAEAGSEQSWV